jgi:hypothetical protein
VIGKKAQNASEPTKIACVPAKQGRNFQPTADAAGSLIYEAARSQCKLLIHPDRIVYADGWAGSAGAVQRKVNARIERLDDPGATRVIRSKLRARDDRMPSIGPQDAMFDVIAAQATTAHCTASPTEESQSAQPALGYAALHTGGDHRINDNSVIKVDPKRQLLGSRLQQGGIKGGQLRQQMRTIVCVIITAPHSVVVHMRAIGADCASLQPIHQRA